MTRMMIVDDEPEILEGTKWAFELAGFEVHTAGSAEEALPQSKTFKPDVFLIDYKLPGKSGLEMLKEIKLEDPGAVAIIITGLTHEAGEAEVISREFGAAGFLHKPLPIQDVLKIVKDNLPPSTSPPADGSVAGSG